MASMYKNIRALNILHVLNDGFQASFILLLPFIAKELGINLTQVGILGSALVAVQIILSIPAGLLAAKFNGFMVLVVAVLLYTGGFFGATIAPTYLWLLVSFLIAGVGLGVFHPIAFALVAKWSQKNTRGKQMGNFTAIGEIGRLGFTVFITQLVVFMGWRSTAFAYGLLGLVVFLLYARIFLRKQERVQVQETESTQRLGLFQIISNLRFILATLTGALDSFASSSLFVFLPFLLLKRGVDASVLGMFSAFFLIGNLMGKYFLGRSVDRFGNTKIFIIAEILMALFILLLANSTSLVLIILFSLVLGALTKGTIPVYQTMVSDSIEHHGNYEKSFGISLFVISITTTLAPIVLGYISDLSGVITAFNAAALFALLAIIPAIGYSFVKPKYIS